MGRHSIYVSSEDHFLLRWGGERTVTHLTFTPLMRSDSDAILAQGNKEPTKGIFMVAELGVQAKFQGYVVLAN